MAKTKTTSWTLKANRTESFRRTVHFFKKDKYGKPVVKDGSLVETKDPITFIFESGKHIDLTEAELDGLETEVQVGMIVPTNFDEKGRHRDPKEVSPDASARIAELANQVEDLEIENADLREQIVELTAPAELDEEVEDPDDEATKPDGE